MRPLWPINANSADVAYPPHFERDRWMCILFVPDLNRSAFQCFLQSKLSITFNWKTLLRDKTQFLPYLFCWCVTRQMLCRWWLAVSIPIKGYSTCHSIQSSADDRIVLLQIGTRTYVTLWKMEQEISLFLFQITIYRFDKCVLDCSRALLSYLPHVVNCKMGTEFRILSQQYK